MRKSDHRVAVYLSPESYEAVRYLSIASDRSMSSIVSELVDSVHPVIQRTARIVALAKEAQSQQREGLKQAVADAEAQMTPALLEIGMHLGQGLSAIERAARPPSGPRTGPGRARPRRVDPRPSNTGVRSGQKKGKRGARK